MCMNKRLLCFVFMSMVICGCNKEKHKLFVIADAKEFNLSQLKIEKELYKDAYKTNIGYVIVTGVGKVKATYSLTRFLTLYKDSISGIYNIGTAGATINNKWGDMVECRKFIQNDYQYKQGKDITKNYSFLKKNNNYTCFTTDKFIESSHKAGKFVFEMESYALAEVAWNFGFKDSFYAIKFVSDIVGQNAVGHWDSDASSLSKRLTKKMIEISGTSDRIK